MTPPPGRPAPHGTAPQTPIDLFASFIHLGQDGTIHTGGRSGDPDTGGWRVSTFHARTDADVHAGHWQVHPEAEQVVCCLIGKMRLYLRPRGPGRREEEVTLTAGTAAVVPRGRWHRLELDTPCTIMTVTQPRGSRLEGPPLGSASPAAR
ncbi:cupin domain-containing protein [Nonomuraea rhodomycinica]|uniref:Cupin domain-containing protein n=1 Tax=Nonomuraea rhodomycinica TaxID=1712872 RepID=A0A7Y6MGD2_9ACTN|nr:cupin domain-containing protein [Nonomuraea rhodomycinica]NUW46847.1 cupin domain-containing protein [Nonomuraea rhodomycinica]